VSSSRTIADARRQATRTHASLAEDVRRLREDAGVSRADVSNAAGIDISYLRRIEDGLERPSIDAYAKIARALGADLSARMYPNTGPAIRDRHQARMLEALLAHLHPRWSRYTEVPVRRPSRGWIDAVLHEPREGTVVATEIQSELRRLEQLIRWSAEKADSLPSWERWVHLGERATTSRLLIVRSTRTTRAVARDFAAQLLAAYPAHPQDAIAALNGTAAWPGPALIWARLEPGRVVILDRR
jgi:transcriptional regulator with XRE-family HTH domain